MYILVHRIRDESCGRRVSHQGKFRNPKGKTSGCPFSSYLLFGHTKRRYSPVKGEIETKKNDDINYWILAFASMTRMRGWIPAFARMTESHKPINSKTSHTLYCHSRPNTASPSHPEIPETQGVPHQGPGSPSTRGHRQPHDYGNETN